MTWYCALVTQYTMLFILLHLILIVLSHQTAKGITHTVQLALRNEVKTKVCLCQD